MGRVGMSPQGAGCRVQDPGDREQNLVMPAKAGIQKWIPACAGMTARSIIYRAYPEFYCTALLACFLLLSPIAGADDWQELKGEHFEVYYLEDAAFAQKVLTEAEKYYERIALDLGYSRYDNFWQWDKRARIYIYRDQSEFSRTMGKESWIRGAAIYGERKIVSYKWSQGFVETLLPHEIAHLIFRDFVGMRADIPLWLDEGVAQWEEIDKRKVSVDIVKGLIRDGEYIPLFQLTRIGSGSEHDQGLSAKLYSQAVTLVGFLIEKHGPAKFAAFCRGLRDGKDMNAALGGAYGDSMRNISDLERGWMEYYGGGIR